MKEKKNERERKKDKKHTSFSSSICRVEKKQKRIEKSRKEKLTNKKKEEN